MKIYIFNIGVINLFCLNKNGFIMLYNNNILLYNSLVNIIGIYVYPLLLGNSNIYIGSTYNISSYITQKKYFANTKKNFCPKLHKYVRKHGGDSLRMGIIKYINKYI